MRRKNQVGCACCAPPRHCFGKCSDWYIDLADATITDSLGTWYYMPGSRLQPSGKSGCPTFSSNQTWKGDRPSCFGVSGDAVYGYGLRCDRGGKLGLHQLFPWSFCLPLNIGDPFQPNLYLDKVLCGWPLAANWTGTPDYQTPTVASGVITATFTIPSSDVGLPAGLSVPVPGTATFSAPIWDPHTTEYICANPCPVPKRTLTATIKKSGATSSVPLAYNGSTRDWSWNGLLFGVQTFVGLQTSPVGTSLNISGVGFGCLTNQFNTYRCHPFHADFLLRDVFPCNLVANGFTQAVVDE